MAITKYFQEGKTKLTDDINRYLSYNIPEYIKDIAREELQGLNEFCDGLKIHECKDYTNERKLREYGEKTYKAWKKYLQTEKEKPYTERAKNWFTVTKTDKHITSGSTLYFGISGIKPININETQSLLKSVEVMKKSTNAKVKGYAKFKKALKETMTNELPQIEEYNRLCDCVINMFNDIDVDNFRIGFRNEDKAFIELETLNKKRENIIRNLKLPTLINNLEKLEYTLKYNNNEFTTAYIAA